MTITRDGIGWGNPQTLALVPVHTAREFLGDAASRIVGSLGSQGAHVSPLRRPTCSSTPRRRASLRPVGAKRPVTFRPRGFSPPRRFAPRQGCELAPATGRGSPRFFGPRKRPGEPDDCSGRVCVALHPRRTPSPSAGFRTPRPPAHRRCRLRDQTPWSLAAARPVTPDGISQREVPVGASFVGPVCNPTVLSSAEHLGCFGSRPCL
jgi:hypothetical protein